MEPLNDLTILLALFPEKPWYSDLLSRNTNISLAFIKAHFTIYNDYRDYPKEFSYYDIKKWETLLCSNPNITIDFYRKYISVEYEYSESFQLSVNPNINMRTIINNVDIGWNDSVALNPNVVWNNIKPNNLLDYSMLSANPNITNDIIRKNSHLPWNFFALSKNPNIHWDLVKNNLDKGWDWYSLSQKIPIDTILANFTYNGRNPNWNYDGMSANPSVTLDIVLFNNKIKWNYSILSLNPGITWENIQNFPNLFNVYSHISQNPNLNWKIVYNNQDKPWNYNILSGNVFGYRTYSWAEFLADKEVDDKVKLTVWNYHVKGKKIYNLELIMAIYNSNNPDYLPLVGYYFTENYPNLGFDVEFDTSLPMKEIIANLEQFVEEEMKQEVEGSQEFERAKERFGQRKKY